MQHVYFKYEKIINNQTIYKMLSYAHFFNQEDTMIDLLEYIDMMKELQFGNDNH